MGLDRVERTTTERAFGLGDAVRGASPVVRSIANGRATATPTDAALRAN